MKLVEYEKDYQSLIPKENILVHAPEFDNIIKVLETPYIDKKTPYKEEIAFRHGN